MHSNRYTKFGIYSALTGFIVLLASLLLFAASMVPERGTYAAQKADGVFIGFAFVVALLFYLAGCGLAAVNLCTPRGAKKRYAVCGILLNGLGLAIAAIGWILFLIIVVSAVNFVGVWR